MGILVYKIIRNREWTAAQHLRALAGSPDDLRDGFLHFSDVNQVRATAQRHFSAGNDLFLLAVEADRMGPELKWEVSRNGEKFPHYYGHLTLDLIPAVHPLAVGTQGHIFPPEVP